MSLGTFREPAVYSAPAAGTSRALSRAAGSRHGGVAVRPWLSVQSIANAADGEFCQRPRASLGAQRPRGEEQRCPTCRVPTIDGRPTW